MLHKGCWDKLCTKMYLWGPQLMAYTAFGSNSYFWRIQKKERGWGREAQKEREREKGKRKLVSVSSQLTSDMVSHTSDLSCTRYDHNTFSIITILFSPGSAQTCYCLFLPIVLLVLTEACFHQVQEPSSMYMYILWEIFISHLNVYYLLSYPLNLVFLQNRLQNKD